MNVNGTFFCLSRMLTGRFLFVTDVNGMFLLSSLLTGGFCPVAAVNRTSFVPTMLNTGRLKTISRSRDRTANEFRTANELTFVTNKRRPVVIQSDIVNVKRRLDCTFLSNYLEIIWKYSRLTAYRDPCASRAGYHCQDNLDFI